MRGQRGDRRRLRFDPVTGAYLGALVSPGSGGLDAPRGLTVRGGYVYVTRVGTDAAAPGKDSVLRYDAVTGAPAGVSGQPGDAVFIASGSGGLDNPSRIAFGPDGQAYVSSTASVGTSATTNSVLRFDGTTGAPAGVSGQPGNAVFVAPGSGGLDGPIALVFRDGYLYVTSWRNDSVFRYDAVSGAFGGEVLTANAGGVNFSAWDLLLEPDGNFLLTSRDTDEILRIGPASQAVFTVRLNGPSATTVAVEYATASGTATSGSDFTPVSGTLTFAPGQTTRAVLVSTLPDAISEGSKAFTLALSNATGATVTGGPGGGTIKDYVATKFYVVDDGSGDRTYEYGAGGTAVEDYGLSSPTAPRGVASDPAGTTVWVVDGNFLFSGHIPIFVYNRNGQLLGHWVAPFTNSNVQIEGIATNGSDIWLLDNRGDRVYKYTGAASRRSGWQSSDSYFNLPYGKIGNTNGKDLVTDGASLWVVDDGSTHRVFKYTLSGSLQGSWTMTGGGGPTEITLDPTGASQDLWVVDSATDKVYLYAGARSRTSGSVAAMATFTLAAGNTNPQNIADPPPPSDGLVGAPTLVSVAGPARRPDFEAARDDGFGPRTRATQLPPTPVAVPAPPIAGIAADWFPGDDFDLAPIDASLPRAR